MSKLLKSLNVLYYSVNNECMLLIIVVDIIITRSTQNMTLNPSHALHVVIFRYIISKNTNVHYIIRYYK